MVILGFLFASLRPASTQPLAIIHGTVIDVTDFGASEKNLHDAVVLIQDGTIRAVGGINTVQIPSDCKVVNARGKYIIPGLIDGFGIVQNRSYANAYLYMGVTSVIGIESARRGRLGRVATPCPHIFTWARIPKGGTKTPSRWDLHLMLKRMKKEKTQVVQLMYPLRPNQMKLAVRSCRKHRIAIIQVLR